jgi:DNA helicase II / ATP-dependent DNA helicase PcrA
MLVKMKEFIDECAEVTMSKELYDYFEFDRFLRATAANFMEDKASIYRLLDIILQYVKEKGIKFLDGLREFINSSALYGVNILQKDISNRVDSVKLMTLHASKGLEFSYVFITGVNYGLIPLQTRGMEEEEEERRLFFVGITRAKDYLELSYYTNPDFYRATSGESRFIRMIPPHLIQNDVMESQLVDLKDLKRQIQKEKEEKNEIFKEETSVNLQPPITIKLVSHKKYGIGKVLKEDEMMVEVEFENYGIKELMKAFSELKFL